MIPRPSNAPRAKSLTGKRVAELAAEIRSCGDIARQVPGSVGEFSYPAMCGALQSTVRGLVRDLAGFEAAAEIERAFAEAFGRAG